MSDEKSAIEHAFFWVPPIIGGIVDYLNQMQKGEKKFSWCGFFVHLISAAFFGWATGMLATGLGYESHIVSVAGGFGGYLGVRMADVVIFITTKNKKCETK